MDDATDDLISFSTKQKAKMSHLSRRLFIYTFFIISETITSCKKEHAFKSRGEIVGRSYGFCSFCRGTYIRIDNDSVERYLLHYPDNLNATMTALRNQYEKSNTPVAIYIDWTSDAGTDSSATRSIINISDIKAR